MLFSFFSIFTFDLQGSTHVNKFYSEHLVVNLIPLCYPSADYPFFSSAIILSYHRLFGLSHPPTHPHLATMSGQVKANMVSPLVRPGPSEIEYKTMKFLIMDRPTNNNLNNFIEVSITLWLWLFFSICCQSVVATMVSNNFVVLNETISKKIRKSSLTQFWWSFLILAIICCH